VGNQMQPYNPGTLGVTRRMKRQRPQPANNFQSNHRCPVCNSANIQPFSSIYGFGTTNYKSHRGLLIPHGFKQTRRQNVLAENCAPPRKMSWWPPTLCAFLAVSCYSLTHVLVNVADLLETGGYGLLWVSLLLSAFVALYNYVLFPPRMEAWSRRLYCRHCGAAFESSL
jgi:hypothetical protein